MLLLSQVLKPILILGYFVVSTYQLCPQSCTCNNNLLTVYCSGSGFSPESTGGPGHLNEIPIFLNPRIQRLNLEGNQIRDLRESLQFYTDLRYLDVSGNRIASLGSSNFESLKSLAYLNVSYNQVSILTEWTFRGLQHVLVTLDVSHNQLEGMDYKVFHNLTLLSLLDLSDNRLEFIDWSIFYGLSSLQVLSLRNNFVKKIERLFLSGHWTLASLAELDLSHNQLTTLESNNFDAFINLRSLQLCCNKIHKFSHNVFNSNVKLVELNLSQNHIQQLPLHLLSKLGELKSVDLSSNHLKTISAHYFHSLFKLEVLDISNNAIISIHPNALLDNINLVQFRGDSLLYLSNISISLLMNKPFLSLASFRYANISTIEFHSSFQLVDTLDLTGNPWNCNCSALGLYSYIKSSNESKLSHSIVCSIPLSAHGLPLATLSSSHFHHCNHIQDSFTNTVLILAAILVTLIVLLILFKISLISGLIKLPERKRRSGAGSGGTDPLNTASVSRNTFKTYHYHHQEQQEHVEQPTAHNHHLYHPPQHSPPPPLHPQYSPPQQQHYRYQQQHYALPPLHQDDYNEDLFVTRNPSNNLTTLQYTYNYDKQVPSVLV